MTKPQAAQYVRDHWDIDDLDDDELEPVFAALYDRPSDEQDRREGLWSHCCAAISED